MISFPHWHLSSVLFYITCIFPVIWAYPNVNQYFSSKSQSECLSVCPVLFRFQQTYWDTPLTDLSQYSRLFDCHFGSPVTNSPYCLGVFLCRFLLDVFGFLSRRDSILGESKWLEASEIEVRQALFWL